MHTSSAEPLLNQRCHHTISVDWILGGFGVSVSRVTSHNEQTVSPVVSRTGSHISLPMRYPFPIMPFWLCAWFWQTGVWLHIKLMQYKRKMAWMTSWMNLQEDTNNPRSALYFSSSILSFLVFILHSFPGFISPSCSSQLQFLDRAPM